LLSEFRRVRRSDFGHLRLLEHKEWCVHETGSTPNRFGNRPSAEVIPTTLRISPRRKPTEQKNIRTIGAPTAPPTPTTRRKTVHASKFATLLDVLQRVTRQRLRSHFKTASTGFSS